VPADAAQAAPRRRARPVLVELASALMIVSGAVSLLLSIQAIINLANQWLGIGDLSLLTIVVAIVELALGLAVRYGRAWLVTVNVVAVLAFLELISGSAIGLFFGLLDTIVVIALFREREWFRSTPDLNRESDLRSYGG
jgi:lysylphosphatidylglycerol synthetase-like protein (DUF2156 family)